MCSVILKESVAYYINNDSTLYCTTLDAINAFDWVEYCKLFKLLIEKNLPATVIMLLLTMYTGRLVRISWNGVCSFSFHVATWFWG